MERRESGLVVPIEACRFWPTTMAHSTMAAPELSMQLSIVCVAACQRGSAASVRGHTHLKLNHLGSSGCDTAPAPSVDVRLATSNVESPPQLPANAGPENCSRLARKGLDYVIQGGDCTSSNRDR